MGFGTQTGTQSVSFSLGSSGGGIAAPTAPLATTSASYYENRADGGFGWAVKYDLGFDGATFRVETRIDLDGADPGSLQNTWEKGIEDIWNDTMCLTDGVDVFPIVFDVRFVDAGAHYTVDVHDGSGRDDMLNWYTDSPWGASYQDELAAHEYGHMIGMFDEYAGGATYNGFTTTGTLMSDLTPQVSPGYFWSVDYFAETLCGRTLTVVEASAAAPQPSPEPAPEPTPEPTPSPQPEPGRVVNGSGASESLSGASGDDSIRGYAGHDTLYGLSGDDTLKGEAGHDTIYAGDGDDSMHGGGGADLIFGEAGNDILWGSAGDDTLSGGGGADEFRYTAGSGDDVITDFNAAEGDRIQLAQGQYHLVVDGSATDAVVALGNGDTITLEGIARHAVQADWFVYA